MNQQPSCVVCGVYAMVRLNGSFLCPNHMADMMYRSEKFTKTCVKCHVIVESVDENGTCSRCVTVK